jgi:CelD/BcsL family acetyltransferase involved in cellulose biosynthesis
MYKHTRKSRSARRPVFEAPVRVVSPAPTEEWVRLTRSSDILPTQSLEWAQCIWECGGWHDRSRLYHLADGRRILVPLAGFGRGRAAVLASWPHGWGYGGALASDGKLKAADVALAIRDLAGLGVLRVSLSPSPFDTAWHAARSSADGRVDYLIHVLDLTGGLDAVWRNYSSNVRYSIRRAERSRLDIRRDDTCAFLPEFTALYRLSAQRWAAASGRPAALGLLQERIKRPARQLAVAARALGPALVVWGAFLDDEPVATIVVLRGRSRVLYWLGAMNRELAARTHANALLHHRAIEEALSEGATCYSFGESDPGSRLAQYKAKFGARPVYWSAYYLERLPVTATISAARGAYARAARLPEAAYAVLHRRG